MRSKKRSWIAILLICCLICGMIPKVVFAENNIFYIKNNYTDGAYLYEVEGILCYGIPMEGDQSFQWEIVKKEGFTLIQNVKTGNCVTLQGHRTKEVEGYWSDPVFCQKFEEGNDTFYWDILEGEGQNIVSDSKIYQSYGLHLEGVTDGKVRSQFIDADQLTWGNMKWDIIPMNRVSFQFATNAGVCIQNTSNEKYLTVKEGVMTYDIPTGADDSYIWILEQKGENIRIKNKLTGDYIKIESGLSNHKEDKTITCNKLVQEDRSFEWQIKLASSVKIWPAMEEYKGYVLTVGEEDNGMLLCKNRKSSVDENASLTEWNVVAASEVGDVAGAFRLPEGVYNLKNSYYSLYMMEEDGKAVYGNVDITDKRAQWRILYQPAENKTALRNEATGHYFYVVEESGELKATEKEVYAWNLLRNKNSLYPDAVILGDSNHQDRYLHMESLSGFIENSNRVQPSWGTPHWIPILVDSKVTTKEIEEFTAPDNFIRIQSVELKNNYLYENNAGAFLYGEYKKEDGRSHWQLIKDEKSGAYLIQNRETEHILMNKGNGILRVVEKEENLPEGALWDIVEKEDSILIHNTFSDRAEYQQPYLNLKKQNGSVQSSLVSNEDKSCWFLIEIAPEKGEQVMSEEELSVSLESYLDTNLYQLEAEDNGITLDGVFQKECYKDSNFFIKVDTKEYLYYKDGWKLETIIDKDKNLYQWTELTAQGETMFENEKQKVKVMKITSDAKYEQESIYLSEVGQSFTVYAKEQGTYQCKLGNTKNNDNVEVLVNGIKAIEIKLLKGKAFELKLNKGINTITFPSVSDIDSLTIRDSINKEVRGATATYRTIEAEDCITTGTVLEKDRTYHEIQSEASGRSAVILDGTGQYLKVELKVPANSIVLRYCIPDSTDGKGLKAPLNLYIDGEKNRSIELTSKYSWSYGTYPWTNVPADGAPHHFFDEVRVMLDKTYPAGTVLKFQKDAACQAAYYIIDFVELEEVASPHEQPENSLSITDFGAIPNDGVDDTIAFLDCLKEAIKQKKEVWIPAGEFILNSPSKDFDAGD